MSSLPPDNLLASKALTLQVPLMHGDDSINDGYSRPHGLSAPLTKPRRFSCPMDLGSPRNAEQPPSPSQEPQGEEELSTEGEPESYGRLFLDFLLLGLQAWGGPMAQIAMLKQRFVVERRVISLKHFNRVQGVYQLIPGPEATELCIYFGIGSHGRLGGLLAGLGFILPGSILMLALSFIYVHVGLGNPYFEASTRAIQPAVAAMMLAAVYRIGKHALLDQDTRKLDIHLLLIAFSSAVMYLLHVNFLLTMGLSALWYYLYRERRYLLLMALAVLCVAAYGTVLVTMGFPSNESVALGVARTVSPQGLFALGFLGGLLSVGGAYSAVPFMEAEATVVGHWMTRQQFLDSLALSSVIPAPMVVFSSFVGFIGGDQLAIQYPSLPLAAAELVGAVLCLVGMFLPAFVITIAAHRLLDRLVHNPRVAALWDGITACVVGLVAITAVRFVKSSVGDPKTHSGDPLAALILVGSLAVLLTLQHPFFTTFVIAAAAVVGQFFYSPSNY